MRLRFSPILTVLALLWVLLPGLTLAADITDFAGTFVGDAELTTDGETLKRDMSVTITPQREGFKLRWTSVTHRADGRIKDKTYVIDFEPSARDKIYRSAMTKNMFGQATPLDPMQGEPFVWARIDGNLFSVFSLFIDVDGGYEVQEFHRTLVPEGLELLFRRIRNGVPEREIQTLLVRQD